MRRLELIFLGVTLVPSDESRGPRPGQIGSYAHWHTGQVIDDSGSRLSFAPISPPTGHADSPDRLASQHLSRARRHPALQPPSLARLSALCSRLKFEAVENRSPMRRETIAALEGFRNIAPTQQHKTTISQLFSCHSSAFMMDCKEYLGSHSEALLSASSAETEAPRSTAGFEAPCISFSDERSPQNTQRWCITSLISTSSTASLTSHSPSRSKGVKFKIFHQRDCSFLFWAPGC